VTVNEIRAGIALGVHDHLVDVFGNGLDDRVSKGQEVVLGVGGFKADQLFPEVVGRLLDLVGIPTRITESNVQEILRIVPINCMCTPPPGIGLLSDGHGATMEEEPPGSEPRDSGSLPYRSCKQD